MSPALALVVDQGSPRRSEIGRALDSIGFDHLFTSVGDAFDEVGRRHPDVVIIAATPSDPSLLVTCLGRLHTAFTSPQYLFLATVSNEDLAISAFHAGAQRYLKEPWTPQMLQSELMALLPKETIEPSVPDGLLGGDRLVGRSQAVRQLRAHIARIAPATSNVLVTGETGTGKEVVAELIHLNGVWDRQALRLFEHRGAPGCTCRN